MDCQALLAIVSSGDPPGVASRFSREGSRLYGILMTGGPTLTLKLAAG
jgi:hypothetical protein